MPEYIKLKDALHILDLVMPNDEIRRKGKAIRKRLKELSTEDVEKVVRCCDCKHKKENPDANNTCYLTCNLKYGLKGTIDPTDFCSYGKRKEGANDG